MKPPVSNREVTSTLQGEHIDLSVDTSAMAHIMSILTNLYNDTEMAVLREYSTNARDANVEVGNDLPIDVKLPSILDPTLKISDRGPGLSLDDIREIYSKYGASTKRGTNDLNGMFGLGCKSALTYTDQFTINSVKDGVRTVVSVSRDAEGGGGMTVVFSGPDPEGFSGTEIVVPTPRNTNFAKKAAELYQWWPEGSVLVDGRVPARWEPAPSTLIIDDGIYVEQNAKASYYDQQKPSVVIMGNVAYPVKLEDFGLQFANGNHRVIAFLPTGSVEPLPSREALRMSTDVKRTLLAVGTRIKENGAKRLDSEIQASKTRWNAAALMEVQKKTTPKMFHPTEWKYNGEVIPNVLKVPLEYEEIEVKPYKNADYTIKKRKAREGWTVVRRYSYSALKDHLRVEQLDVALYSDPSTVFFYGFDVDFTANHRKRLELWSAEKSFSISTWVMVKNKVDTPWIDPDRWFNWEEVRKIKLPVQNRGGSGVLSGVYDLYLPGEVNARRVKALEASAIDQTKPIYYYVENERTSKFDRSRAENAERWVRIVNSDPATSGTVALIPEFRRAKFVRDFPQAQNIKNYVKDLFTKWFVGLSEKQKLALKIYDTGLSGLRHFDESKINDPLIVDAVTAVKTDVKAHRDQKEKFENLGFNPDLPKWQSPLVEYPLIDHYHLERGNHIHHATLYINAVHDSKTGKV